MMTNDPALVAMLDQLQTSDNELLEFIRGAGPDITVRTIADPGPVVGAVIDRAIPNKSHS